MKKYIYRIWFLVIVLLLFEPHAIRSQQHYSRSLMVHYGLLQYNSSRNDFFDFGNNSLLSTGLTYRQQLGRLTGLNFTGRYYEWTPNLHDELKTYSFQTLVVLQLPIISSSWRVNRLAPYLGAGIGYQGHTLLQEGKEFEFTQFYLPIEAGLMFNFSSRWSAGIFAEYKFPFDQAVLKKAVIDGKNPDLVNSAGVTLSWHFGHRKHDISFPVVSTSPWVQETPEILHKPTGHNVRFTVRDANNLLISGATITFDDATGVTGESGVYTFNYVKPGNYSFTVSSLVHLTESRKVTLSDRDLALTVVLKKKSVPSEPEKPTTADDEIMAAVQEKPAEDMIHEPGIDPESSIPEAPEISEIVVGKKVEKVMLQLTDTLKSELVVIPKIIYPETDTLRIPVVFDLSQSQIPIRMMTEDVVRTPFDDRSARRYESKIDSLLHLTKLLNNRINRLENITARQTIEVRTQYTQPDTTVRVRSQADTPPPPDHELAALIAQMSNEAELSGIRQQVKNLSDQVMQMSLDNQNAIEALKNEVTALRATPRETIVWQQQPPLESITRTPEQKFVEATPDQDTMPVRPESEIYELLTREIKNLNRNQQALLKQLNELQQDLKVPEERPAKPEKQEEPEEKPVAPDIPVYNIRFAVNSTEVGDEHLSELVKMTFILNNNPEKMILLSGYADATGNPAYNMILSQKRVQSVKEAIMKLGVQGRQIVEQYFGSEKAVGGLNPEERRVELKIIR